MLLYKWPGNIREIENIVRSSIALSNNNIIGFSDMPPDFKRCFSENSIEILNLVNNNESIILFPYQLTIKKSQDFNTFPQPVAIRWHNYLTQNRAIILAEINKMSKRDRERALRIYQELLDCGGDYIKAQESDPVYCKKSKEVFRHYVRIYPFGFQTEGPGWKKRRKKAV
jgi:DNA-binding NtrC family response regulator